MKVGFIAMSGIGADAELLQLGLTLPGFAIMARR
jgi:hypothetical protein